MGLELLLIKEQENVIQANQEQDKMSGSQRMLYHCVSQLIFGASAVFSLRLLPEHHFLKGRTEIEQLHKIYKLFGSPDEEFWKKNKASFSN